MELTTTYLNKLAISENLKLDSVIGLNEIIIDNTTPISTFHTLIKHHVRDYH